MRPALLFAAAAAVVSLALGACATVPKSVTDDLNAEQIIQKAQEASDVYNYKAAIVYYQALLDRYGSDVGVRCEGEYELAFIAYKQDRLADAQDGFEKLLALYAQPGGDSLPQSYKILAQKVLDHVKELRAKQK